MSSLRYCLHLLNLALLLALTWSAMQLTWLEYRTRTLYAALDVARERWHQLEDEQLMLREQLSTLMPLNVDALAREQLHMKPPGVEEILYLGEGGAP